MDLNPKGKPKRRKLQRVKKTKNGQTLYLHITKSVKAVYVTIPED